MSERLQVGQMCAEETNMKKYNHEDRYDLTQGERHGDG